MTANAFPSVLLLFNITFATVYGISKAQPPPEVTEATLLKVAKSLKMYVDELPQVPKLNGYDLVGALPKPTGLTVGMYEKKFYRLSLTNGLFFIQVGSDASYLPSPVITQSILVAPSEGADLIIDFSSTKANECLLTNDAPYPFPSGDPNHNYPIDNSKIPRKLTSYPVATTEDAVTKRYITLYEYESSTGDPTHLLLNGKKFEDPVTETPKVGATEDWEVIKLTEDNHPFHIHLATFQEIRVQELVDFDALKACMTANNDAVACNVTAHAAGKLLHIPSYEKTWKNVVKMVPGYITTIVVKFNLLHDNVSYPFDATGEPGYVYHCHILDHEDNVMVRPLKLVA
ncbi:hypothetical protein Pfo_011581 [Paulownia fortunei]|nr:hypothetical protein Pfo_011581 [Paulownia fortunei]